MTYNDVWLTELKKNLLVLYLSLSTNQLFDYSQAYFELFYISSHEMNTVFHINWNIKSLLKS